MTSTGIRSTYGDGAPRTASPAPPDTSLGLAAARPPLGALDPQAGPFERLAATLEPRLDRIAASVLERVREKQPPPPRGAAGDPRRLAEFTRESLRAQIRSFRQGALPERCPAVDAAAALSRIAELEVLLIAYRAAQITLWDAWFDLVENSPEPLAEQRRDLLQRGSDFFFRYADLLSEYAAEAYRDRLAQSQGGCEQRRFEAVEAILEGEPLAASSLDLDLGRHHLGLIAWGEDPTAAARRLAAELGRPLLAVTPPRPGSGCWAWISGTRPLAALDQRRLRSFEPGAARIALGLEAFGEAGFRATHRQALRALRFARVSAAPALHYEDLAVEALASENEEDARAFVANELRGIEDDSLKSRRLRETLRAYFDAEYNAACAAATLGVHQQTVANRLRAAEERLGQPSIRARRVELELALRLRACLLPDPPGPSFASP